MEDAILDNDNLLRGMRETLAEVAILERYARLGRWVERVLTGAASLTIVRTNDGEYAVEVGDVRQAWRKAAAPELEEALAMLEQEGKERRCLGECGKAKPLEEFSLLRNGPLGRNRYCKQCEAARKRRHKARQQACSG